MNKRDFLLSSFEATFFPLLTDFGNFNLSKKLNLFAFDQLI